VQVAIVDYGMGNLDSVARAVEECGGRPLLTDSPRDLAGAAAVILPGVGAFAKGMANIRERGLDRVLVDDVAADEVPLLGVCLGMQLLATTGTEGGVETAGLGLVPGRVERLQPPGGLRVPHVGWNEVHHARPNPLFDGIDSGRDFYFVHSYAMRCDDPDDVVATVPYGDDVVAAVARGSVAGVQFHPEKSQKTGFRLLRNFLAATERPVEPALTFSRPRR
jgi:imidazole glycerol-phosphate synthase subunit HisH